MKTLLIILIGLIGAYFLSVAGFNAWNFLAGLEPVEVVKRLSFFAWTFAVCAFCAKAIMSVLSDIDF